MDSDKIKTIWIFQEIAEGQTSSEELILEGDNAIELLNAALKHKQRVLNAAGLGHYSCLLTGQDVGLRIELGNGSVELVELSPHGRQQAIDLDRADEIMNLIIKVASAVLDP